MSKNKTKNESVFSGDAKKKLPVGKELNDGGLIWRKLKDGTGVWRCDIKINGARKKATIGRERDHITLSQARTEYELIKSKFRLDQQKLVGNSASLSDLLFSVAARDFLEHSKVQHDDYVHNETRMRIHLSPILADMTLASITPAKIEGIRTSMLKRDYAVSMIRKVTALLSVVFEHARKQDPSLVNPARGLSKLRSSPKEIETFSRKETDILLAGAQDFTGMQSMLGLGLFAGLRAGEVIGLDWKDVDLDHNYLTIRQSVVSGKLKPSTKSGHIRYVPISQSLKVILDRHSKVKNTGFVISNESGNHYYQVQSLFNRLKKKSGLVDSLGFHSLRHT